MITEKKAKFAMAFHCCQPVFNFEHEKENAYRTSYLPLVKTLEKFPGIRASFHYSGNMIEWFERFHPEYIECISRLVERRQIEIIGGGIFEPLMALIPERDRKEQLRMNESNIERIFGTKTRGIWISERLWEPELIKTLCSAGVEYTIVDDYHIMNTGAGRNELLSPCRTMSKEGEVILFPAISKLRYLMPFRPPEDTLEYMKTRTSENPENTSCFFFADDGEKFGSWPYTYNFVHKKGWLRDFFNMLENNSDWLETVTYSDVVDVEDARDVGEVPSCSYPEMMEWSDGDFKNFFTKYPESGRMQERMLSLSEKIEKERVLKGHLSGSLKKAQRELFKAQSSCAYWHGTFGGVYLPHLRSGVYEHIIKGNKMLSGDAGRKENYVRSVEHDLLPRGAENVIENKYLSVFVGTSEGGAVTELDYKPKNVNVMNTISRVKEKYHKKLEGKYASKIRQARSAAIRGEFVDVHDVLGIGEKGLKKILRYDTHRKSSFITHIIDDKIPWHELCKKSLNNDNMLKGEYASSLETKEDLITQRLSRRDKVFTGKGDSCDIEVVKEVTVGLGPSVMFLHRIIDHSGVASKIKYAVEFNFLIWDRFVISKARHLRSNKFHLKDRYSGLVLGFFLDKEYDICMDSIFSVNETEGGLRKTFQGISVLIGNEYEDKNVEDMNIAISMG